MQLLRVGEEGSNLLSLSRFLKLKRWSADSTTFLDFGVKDFVFLALSLKVDYLLSLFGFYSSFCPGNILVIFFNYSPNDFSAYYFFNYRIQFIKLS